MPGLMSTLYTSYSGMSVSQTNIQTASHNINNMNTAGYSRQQVVQSQRSAYSYPGLYSSKLGAGQVGQGVQATDIVRVRNSFYDFQFRNESHNYGETVKKYEAYTHMESIFNEPSDSSISSAYNDFYMAWQELSKRPGDAGSIDVVVQNSDYLAQNINSVLTKLESMQSQIDKDIQDNVDSINSSIDTLRELDKHIKLVEGSGKTPNDLYDQRDAIIDELSFKMDLTKDDTQKFLESAMEPGREVVVGEDAQGNTVLKVSVKEVYNSQGSYLGSVDLTKPLLTKDDEGNNVVTGYEVLNSRGESIGYMEVDAQGDPAGAVYLNGNGEAIIAPNDIQLDLSQASGELQGSVDMIKNIDTYIKDLKDMSKYLADAVNEILNDPPVLDEDGEEIRRELFIIDANGKLSVSPDAKTMLGSIPGNDMVDMSGKIYNLKNEAIIPVSDSNGQPVLDSNGEPKLISLNTFYNDMIQRLGNETQQVMRDESNQSKILNEIESSRISVTGVSLDEEMINLIQFQHSYNASAKVISIIDSLLEVVVNGLKR